MYLKILPDLSQQKNIIPVILPYAHGIPAGIDRDSDIGKTRKCVVTIHKQ